MLNFTHITFIRGVNKTASLNIRIQIHMPHSCLVGVLAYESIYKNKNNYSEVNKTKKGSLSELSIKYMNKS